MSEPHYDPLTAIKELEDKLDMLIVKYDLLKKENKSLKLKQETLINDKARLLEKAALARTRVEAMISRLKSMEHGA